MAARGEKRKPDGEVVDEGEQGLRCSRCKRGNWNKRGLIDHQRSCQGASSSYEPDEEDNQPTITIRVPNHQDQPIAKPGKPANQNSSSGGQTPGSSIAPKKLPAPVARNTTTPVASNSTQKVSTSGGNYHSARAVSAFEEMAKSLHSFDQRLLRLETKVSEMKTWTRMYSSLYEDMIEQQPVVLEQALCRYFGAHNWTEIIWSVKASSRSFLENHYIKNHKFLDGLVGELKNMNMWYHKMRVERSQQPLAYSDTMIAEAEKHYYVKRERYREEVWVKRTLFEDVEQMFEEARNKQKELIVLLLQKKLGLRQSMKIRTEWTEDVDQVLKQLNTTLEELLTDYLCKRKATCSDAAYALTVAKAWRDGGNLITREKYLEYLDLCFTDDENGLFSGFFSDQEDR